MAFQISLQEMSHSPCVATTVEKMCVSLSVQKGAVVIFLEMVLISVGLCSEVFFCFYKYF